MKPGWLCVLFEILGIRMRVVFFHVLESGGVEIWEVLAKALTVT